MRDAILNIRDVWQEGYQRLLDEARERGDVQMRGGLQERREHPRFPVRSGDVTSPEQGPVAVEDMSITGISFFTPVDPATRRELTLSLANVFSTDLDVLACERLPDEADGTPRYRVRCRFRNPDHGLQFLTLTLELDRIERT